MSQIQNSMEHVKISACGLKSEQTLDVQRLRERVHYSPETGVFVWSTLAGRWGRLPAGRAAGGFVGNYFKIHIDGRLYYAHRLAWLYMTGHWPIGEVDHINGNPRDNRFANLRDVHANINRQNMVRAQSNNKCGLLGASWHAGDKKWRARIALNGKTTYLGAYDSAEMAHAAYVEGKRRLHLGCTL